MSGKANLYDNTKIDFFFKSLSLEKSKYLNIRFREVQKGFLILSKKSIIEERSFLKHIP